MPYPTIPRRTICGGQGKVQDLGQMPLLGCTGGVFWSSQVKPGLVNSNQKCQILVSHMGLSSRGT